MFICAAILAINLSSVAAQVPLDTSATDSLVLTKVAIDSARIATDTLGQPDSLLVRRTYRISPDGLDEEVAYSMRDSMRYSIRDKTIYLYGDASVVYGDLTLTAGYMEIDYGNNILIAEPVRDSFGTLSELPSFKQGDQEFEAKGLRYNIETRKGIVYNATTQQGDLYVLGGKTKIVAADPNDPTRTDNTIYNSDAIITTCDLAVPHYGIHSNKQKVVQNKQVIVGPSNVELGGVPTPLWLPFGFFPVGTSERSGLLFPSDYTYTAVDGFGFQQIGWYFPWNDAIHSSVTADIFLKGTLRFNTTNNYAKRYRYIGSLAAGASRNRAEDQFGNETFGESYSLTWSHAQDQKANPYRNFRANVNIQTNNYARINGQTIGSQITNTFRSNLGATFQFPAHPSWNLTVGATHSQNTETRRLEVSAPDARFSTGQIYPFADLGTKSTAWYKKAVINYTAQFRGEIEATDTTLFDSETWEDIVLGGQHNVTFNAPINFAKYFRISPNINFQQTAYFDEFRMFYLRQSTFDSVFTVIGGDTIRREEVETVRGVVVDSLLDGYSVANSFSANVSVQTNIFGTARFKLGSLRGLRHIITPSVNIGYTPDYSDAPFNYYDSVQVNEAGQFDSYLRFPDQPFTPSNVSDDLSLRIGYSLGNRLETKIQGRKDTTSRIIALINNLNFTGSYNLAVDSFQWSPISVSGARLKLFKDIISLNAGGGRFDVYDRSADGRRVDTLLLSKGKVPICDLMLCGST